jgi:hypothetical protein
MFNLPPIYKPEKEDGTPKFKLPEHLVGTVIKPEPVIAKPIIPILRRPQMSLEGVPNSRVDPTKYRGNGHWQFPEELGTKEYFGFIYIIRDVENNKLYLGKKNFRTMKKIEGTTRRQSTDLNWRWYISSSDALSIAVKLHGKDKFEFVAIEQYKSKGALPYAETWSLMYAETPVRQDIWYNRLVNKVSWIVKEPITQRHKDRMHMMLRAIGENV